MKTKRDLIGKTVELESFGLGKHEYWIEGYWDELPGNKPWAVDARNRIACFQYVMRVQSDELPMDDSVFYGKIGDLGYLVHECEIGKVIREGR